MPRTTGTYRSSTVAGETVRAFVPAPLPPARPALQVEGPIDTACARAMTAISRLEVAASLVPSTEWFLYGFVRKEAVLTSQIEGTEATLRDVLEFEVTEHATHEGDVVEVCNYVEALTYARRELAKPKGLPLSARLLCEAHRRLMRDAGTRRGGDKKPGVIRTSQNWVGGTRPGNARFVPLRPMRCRGCSPTSTDGSTIDGSTGAIRFRHSSRPGWRTCSSRRSTPSWTATVGSGACSSPCSSSTGA